jgi:murein DD-endopeptidase MepM/ murein hydrolase activator NlpD
MNPILTLPCLRIHPVVVALLLASGCSSEGAAVKDQPAAAASSAVAASASSTGSLATGGAVEDGGPTRADPGRLVVDGKLAQGSLVFARITGKVARITFPGHRAVVNDDGSLPIAFYLHAPKTETMEIHFADGSVLEHVFAVEARTFKTEEIDNLPQSSVTLDPTAQVAHNANEARIEAVRMKSSAKICYEDGFTWPVVGKITSPYGDPRRLCGVDAGIHMGVDIGVPVGTPVKAPACGTVVFAEAGDPVNGTTLVLDHGRGVTSTYLHLTDFKTKVGDEVKQGDVLATSGTTGRSTGPHIHWGINYFELRLDPELLASPMPAK